MTPTNINLRQFTAIANGELQKSQLLRLIDVFVLGPFMIYAAMQKDPPALLRAGLAIAGVATILYNARNYSRNLSAP